MKAKAKTLNKTAPIRGSVPIQRDGDMDDSGEGGAKMAPDAPIKTRARSKKSPPTKKGGARRPAPKAPKAPKTPKASPIAWAMGAGY
jgi:hypothetical protein